MLERRHSDVWLWREPDCRWRHDVINHMKSIEPGDREIVLLNCSEVDGFDDSIPFVNFIVNLSEKFNIFQKEKAMFLNPKDLFQAAELCLGRSISKNHEEDMQITDEEIVNCYKAYIRHFQHNSVLDKAVLHLKEFIEENNCADLWLMHDLLLKHKADNCDIMDYLSGLKILVLGTPPSDIFLNIIHLMVPNGVVMNVVVETPLNISLQGSPSNVSPTSSIEITSEPLHVEEIPLDLEGEVKLGSAAQEYVEDIITSFLSLLVNSRNELALSKAMISPIIDLSHEAFTKLKHLAEEKEMPMCQTAISYVTRVQLGGRGYAPSADCPMMPHLKSLELFVDTLNQMQTLVEEEPTPILAIKRLVNILKKKLLKYGSDKFRPSAIKTASENLKKVAAKVLEVMKSEECKNSRPQVCQENLDFVHHFVNYINSCCWTFDPKIILLQKNSKRTPISLPPLLGYFRSPEEESSCDVKLVLDEDSILSNNSASLQPPISYFHHSESSSISVTCVDSTTPSKMSFKDCLTNDILRLEAPSKNSHLNKSRKRSILGEITNDNTDERAKKVENKPSNDFLKTKEVIKGKKTAPNIPRKETKTKFKGSKKFKLIEGQGKITSFFIMK